MRHVIHISFPVDSVSVWELPGALIMNPKLIIADECISALDVFIQAQVVNLMKRLQNGQAKSSDYNYILTKFKNSNAKIR